MFSRSVRTCYKVYGGRVYLDVKLWSTLEPHAEKFQISNVPVDPTSSGLVLPMTSAVVHTAKWARELVRSCLPLENKPREKLAELASKLGTGQAGDDKAALIRSIKFASGAERFRKSDASGHLLKDVFRSWPRLHHQREFERPYLSSRINVLELGPFEVLLGGLERPLVCNVQFAEDMPVNEDGVPDIRIGADILRRSHYLVPDLLPGGLIHSVYKGAGLQGGVRLANVGFAGAVPNPSSPKQTLGAGRLYADDQVKMHWSSTDGRVTSFPPVPLSRKRDLVGDQWQRRKDDAKDEWQSQSESDQPPQTRLSDRNPAKKWEGWKA
ncbi:hypothetical protein DIPPA_14094 [Diplonema papillatum]|nr:hypothetical protein DIPPA_14094 [Diplonema papillatum]